MGTFANYVDKFEAILTPLRPLFPTPWTHQVNKIPMNAKNVILNFSNFFSKFFYELCERSQNSMNYSNAKLSLRIFIPNKKFSF